MQLNCLKVRNPTECFLFEVTIYYFFIYVLVFYMNRNKYFLLNLGQHFYFNFAFTLNNSKYH